MAQLGEATITLNLDEATTALIGIRSLSDPEKLPKGMTAKDILAQINWIASNALAQVKVQPREYQNGFEAHDRILTLLAGQLPMPE